MINKTFFAFFLTLIFLTTSAYAQLGNLTQEQLKKLAVQKGISTEEFLKLQQTQAKGNLTPSSTGKQDTVFLSKPQVKPQSSLTVKAFSGRGAEVDYNDPFVPKLSLSRKYKYDMESISLTAQSLSLYDLVLLSTNHDYYKENSKLIIQNSQLIVDTRNLFKNYKVFKG